MPSEYLLADERVNYGVPNATTPQIQQASILVDAHLKRPEGLEYIANSVDGSPVCMFAKTPSATFTVAGGLATGTDVVATLSGPLQMLKKGAALTVDKSAVTKAETLLVKSVNGATVTFERVLYAHTAPATLEAGLLIDESKHLASGRGVMLMARTPVVQFFSVEGRYGPTRRGNYPFPHGMDFDLVQIASQFSPQGVWEQVNLAQLDFQPDTGEVWLPAGMLMAPFTEVRVGYVAGFRREHIPSQIKQVVANLIQNQAASPLAGNVKLIRAGDTQIERFLATVMGQDELKELESFRARVYA